MKTTVDAIFIGREQAYILHLHGLTGCVERRCGQDRLIAMQRIAFEHHLAEHVSAHRRSSASQGFDDPQKSGLMPVPLANGEPPPDRLRRHGVPIAAVGSRRKYGIATRPLL